MFTDNKRVLLELKVKIMFAYNGDNNKYYDKSIIIKDKVLYSIYVIVIKKQKALQQYTTPVAKMANLILHHQYENKV